MSKPPEKPAHLGEFTSFMRAYQDMVFSTAARLAGDRTQAEDIAQQVFLKAYENFDQLRSSVAARAWLKTVATHLTLNHLSRYRKRWKFFSELRTETAEDEGPELQFAAPENVLEGVADEERQARVEEAIRELPENHRVPLVLYHFEALPYQEISERLGVSLSKVKTDIMRARAALTRRLMQS